MMENLETTSWIGRPFSTPCQMPSNGTLGRPIRTRSGSFTFEDPSWNVLLYPFFEAHFSAANIVASARARKVIHNPRNVIFSKVSFKDALNALVVPQ